MDISSVTEKGQATIPASIRKRLGIKKGDKVLFRMERGKAVLRKVDPVDWGYLKMAEETLKEEWLSPEDCEAYDDL